ncbi:hypothetical protein Pcinc_041980 [Petrolisthes cinctipes]|uniref:Uncharacterized protein n=1 Tax=Petrolisthes cinctipes TaxID=88211 RepID=A0AAE1EHU0_PETCI|nr:hypothetical protein Pcinc_041980 [Petrolisthes cinctipes]
MLQPLLSIMTFPAPCETLECCVPLRLVGRYWYKRRLTDNHPKGLQNDSHVYLIFSIKFPRDDGMRCWPLVAGANSLIRNNQYFAQTENIMSRSTTPPRNKKKKPQAKGCVAMLLPT